MPSDWVVGKSPMPNNDLEKFSVTVSDPTRIPSTKIDTRLAEFLQQTRCCQTPVFIVPAGAPALGVVFTKILNPPAESQPI